MAAMVEMVEMGELGGMGENVKHTDFIYKGSNQSSDLILNIQN
jgi:hypothetical protein